MRILHFITSLRIGGAQAVLFNLLEHWKSNDCKNDHIVLYIYHGPFVEKIESLGVKTYQLKGFVWPYDFVSIYRLMKIVKKIKPDIIHSALWSANVTARVASKFYKIPLICDLHGDCRFHGSFRNFIERKTIKIPKKFISVSHAVDKSFKRMFGNNFSGSVVIQNGINSEKYRQKVNEVSREDFGLKKDSFVIGTVGRLKKIKSHDLLLKSFAKFSKKVENSNLCIVGNGPEREFLENLAAKLKIKNKVIFFGEQKDPSRFYQLFDCFVLSSKSEGLSIALLEALSFGLPIVTTNDGMEHDVITDGVNGFVVPVNNENSLSNSFNLICTNENLRKRIREANLSLVKEKFDISNVALKYDKLYRQICCGN